MILDYFIHVATWQPWLSVSDCCRILELTREGGEKRGLRKGEREAQQVPFSHSFSRENGVSHRPPSDNAGTKAAHIGHHDTIYARITIGAINNIN